MAKEYPLPNPGKRGVTLNGGQWSNLVTHIANGRKKVESIGRTYSLTPEQVRDLLEANAAQWELVKGWYETA